MNEVFVKEYTIKVIGNDPPREDEEPDQHSTVTVIANDHLMKYEEPDQHSANKVNGDDPARRYEELNQPIPEKLAEEFTCKYCQKGFKARTTMHKHQIKCKMNLEGKTIPKLINEGGCFYCSKCQKHFMSKTSGYRHTKVCTIDITSQEKNLNETNHVEKRNEPKDLTKTKADGTYYCNACQKSFKCRQSLYKHEKYCGISYSFVQQKEVVKEECFQCDNCKKSFESALSLHKHEKICEINSFICNICGEAFDNTSMLCAHEISHSSADKPKELRFNEIVRDGEKFLCKKYNSCSELGKMSQEGVAEAKQFVTGRKDKNMSGQCNGTKKET